MEKDRQLSQQMKRKEAIIKVREEINEMQQVIAGNHLRLDRFDEKLNRLKILLLELEGE